LGVTAGHEPHPSSDRGRPVINQARALRLSLLIHIVMIASVLLANHSMEQAPNVMVVDLVRRRPPLVAEMVETPGPVQGSGTKVMGQAARSAKKKESPRRSAGRTRTPVAAEIPAAANPPEAKHIENRPLGLGPMDGFRLETPRMPTATETAAAANIPEIKPSEKDPLGIGLTGRSRGQMEGSSGVGGNVTEKSGTGAGRGGKEGSVSKAVMVHAAEEAAARTNYFNEQFSYIRDKILRNVHYPDAARRMGWQGKVILSFVIAADGSVRDFRIVQSSGFSILDRSAIETVSDTAPFPKPPGEAQLVIPIVYRLDNRIAISAS
jgi:periplasmic protein TonB